MNPSPLRYPGGKYKLYRFISKLVENNNCSTYIEPFAGGSALSLAMLFNGVVKRVIINDYDYSIYCFWDSVINKTDDLIRLIQLTPITLEEWHQQKSIRENLYEHEPLKVGFSTFFLNRVNRSGIIDKAGPIGGLNQTGNYSIDCRFNKENLIKRINKISKYKDAIRICNLDAMDFIHSEITKTRNSFTFFDPPYYKKGQGLYTNFYTHGDHENLSKTISNTMRNRKWIVTYDSTSEIKQIYSKYDSITFSLSYTLQEKKNGSEYMFFSKKINRLDNERELINIITHL
ncbi:DNA methyltransferase [Brevibacillus sp. SKDU10]|uniref:DNA adenine methylase n=1 Tax=Brevibacillus sp. SKDU10 TaxID=1247872 RepID=UPI0007C8D13D|nr:DNA adenine methylase [Brevibacillus sp. SKDU10]OAJ73632.1 DNA methyltransferase [Brevibacillus sp. SKDU10]